jgi:hypothetical protein
MHAGPVPGRARTAAGEQFDVVLDLVRSSREEVAQLGDLVTGGGAFVGTTVASPEEDGRGMRTVEVSVRSDAAQLAELVKAGRCRTSDDRRG